MRTIQTANNARAGASAAAADRREPVRAPRGGNAAERPKREGRRGRDERKKDALGERLIAGVPARIMRPRLVFLVSLAALVLFGLLMVYSASSVSAMHDAGDPAYFFKRQLIFAVMGVALIVALAWFPWAFLRGRGIWVCYGAVFVFLLAVIALGVGSRGATRWIDLGFFTLQPSEFAKPMLVLLCAKLCQDYYGDHVLSSSQFVCRLGVAAVVMLGTIFIQPDLGTTLIILVTLFAMMYLNGISKKLVLGVVAVAAVFVLLALFSTPYRIERLRVMLDPWQDPYNEGYQATLAIMAFASGGLFGRGIGNSTMKYSYLPEAHNDYILAVIGEEVGFVGTLLFFAVFVALVLAAFRIARQAPSLFDRLVAEGSAICLAVQFLVNALGILGAIPMTGKPLPFISYGGSALLSSMVLAGLILRVSINSAAKNVYGARREDFAVMSEDDMQSAVGGRSTAGAPRVRRGASRVADTGSSRPHARRDGFTVLEGRSAPGDSPRERPSAGTRQVRDAGRYERGGSSPVVSRRSSGEGGYERINLGQDASSRLRGDEGPRVRTRGGAAARNDRASRAPADAHMRGGKRDEGPSGRGRDGRGRGRYDR